MNSARIEGIVQDLASKAIGWAETSGLSILVILIATLAALRFYNVLARKIENVMLEHGGEFRSSPRVAEDH